LLRLSWLQLQGGHGYASVATNFKHQLSKSGATIIPGTSFDWDAVIAFHPASNAALVGPHKRPDLVFHTMTETYHLPKPQVDLLNRTGVVWVPSLFCQEVFEDSGVQVPIFTVGYGIEANPVRRVQHDGPFRVLAWGDTLTSRKNILTAIQAFIAANLPDAVLEVKLNLGGLPVPTMSWSDDSGDHPNITICHDNWSNYDIQEWLLSGDVGVYLSAGEGYGLMPKEMMATGLPMISVINTGLWSYLNRDVVLYVPSDKLKPSPYFDRIFNTTGMVEHEPDFEAIVAQLHYAYNNREAIYDLGMRGGHHVAQYTWERAGKEAFEQLLEYYG
jgi:glycosyltransferase involved in cell wall biosynthesis